MIVKDKRILATGYNGAPMGCNTAARSAVSGRKLNVPPDRGMSFAGQFTRSKMPLSRLHTPGTSVNGGTLYVTTQPCILCAKMAINADKKDCVQRRLPG